jgi:hypothetical protein
MKVKITIPERLEDIKLSQYQKFIRTTKGSEDENFIVRQMVGIFCNIPDDVVGSIRANDYEGIITQITSVLEQKPTFIQRFKKDGIEYGFIPKLDDITVDEKADLDTYYQDVQSLDKAMAVLYRPIEHKFKDGYTIEEYKGKGKLDVNLNIAFGANVFFSTLMSDLLNCTRNFIENQLEHNYKVSQILEKNGIGINHTMDSLREISQNLIKWVS